MMEVRARRLLLFLLGTLALGLSATPGAAEALDAVFRAGLTQQYAVTSGPDGYGNHGKYDGTNGQQLDDDDRRHANWDRAPGLVIELAGERAVSWSGGGRVPLSLALEPYARLTLVDTEFNETQHNWWYLTQTAGARAVVPVPYLPWLSLLAGAGLGGGHVAREVTAVAEHELGVRLGPFQITQARQFLEGGRQVNQLYATFDFDVGETASGGPLTEAWSLSAFTRLTRHPRREVKNIHQTGTSLSYYFGGRDDVGRFVVEVEASLAPVESLRNRPLRDDVAHNYRTQDEVFWALYFGQRRRLASVPWLYVDVRAGLEAFYENDERVNPDLEKGWFVGVKSKLGLWANENRVVSYGVNLVAGQDTFGFNYGAEAAISTRL